MEIERIERGTGAILVNALIVSHLPYTSSSLALLSWIDALLLAHPTVWSAEERYFGITALLDFMRVIPGKVQLFGVSKVGFVIFVSLLSSSSFSSSCSCSSSSLPLLLHLRLRLQLDTQYLVISQSFGIYFLAKQGSRRLLILHHFPTAHSLFVWMLF